MTKDASKFTEKRRRGNIRRRFLQVLEYVVFCYDRLIEDNKNQNVSYCISHQRQHSLIHFEDWLKIRLVEDYLQKQKLAFPGSFIQEIHFQYETSKPYSDHTGRTRVDKIDIFISNLGLQKYWSGTVEENRYFAIECKRLKNKSNNPSYISDIEKFVDRQHQSRSPFEGMIGFVEKSSISMEDIIDDINGRLTNHSTIRTIQQLSPFPIHKTFKYCRFSKHEKIGFKGLTIEVYHLFLDYSDLIVD